MIVNLGGMTSHFAYIHGQKKGLSPTLHCILALFWVRSPTPQYVQNLHIPYGHTYPWQVLCDPGLQGYMYGGVAMLCMSHPSGYVCGCAAAARSCTVRREAVQRLYKVRRDDDDNDDGGHLGQC